MRICIIGLTRMPDEHVAFMEDRLRSICGRVIAPDTEIHFRAPKGGPLVPMENMADYRNPYFCHLINSNVIECVAAADKEGFDAMVINCFDDPGMKEARAFSRSLVFGLSEPTFAYAAQLGPRLGGLVPNLPGQVAFVENQVRQFGLWDRFITNGVRADEGDTARDFTAAMADPSVMTGRLLRQAKQMVDEGAEAIVLACGGLGLLFETAGIYSLAYGNEQVAIVSPLTVAVKTAENSVTFQNSLGMPVLARRRSQDDFHRFREGWGLAH